MNTEIIPAPPFVAKPRILVIEDQVELKSFIVELLTGSGWDVKASEYGEEALKIAQSADFDLILSDVDLPDINGFEVCRRLQADPKTKPVPVIVMSGRLADNFDSEAFESGAVDYIAKPFCISELRSKISSHIRNRA